MEGILTPREIGWKPMPSFKHRATRPVMAPPWWLGGTSDHLSQGAFPP